MSIAADPLEVQGKANVDSLMYVADEGTPWHGLGKPVAGALTSADAITAAGLNWDVSIEDVVTASGLPITDMKGCKAIVREDRHEVIGTVGRRYRPLQNHEAFSFMDSIAADRTIRYHTAGALGRGERVWMLAQLAGEITIPKTDDHIQKFLLLYNSHDGTSGVRVLWTPIRVVCANTLNQAIRGRNKDGVHVRHTGDVREKIAQAQQILGLAVKAYDDIEGQIFASAKVKMTDGMRAAYFRALLAPARNDEDGNQDEITTRTKNILASVERLAHEGKGNDAKGIRGSLWASYNAVTEFVDHGRGTRVTLGSDGMPTGDARSARLESMWFGAGARLKESAWTLAQSVIKGGAGVLAGVN